MATSRNDVAPDTTAIISLACEWGLYGTSLLLYGATIRELISSQTSRVDRRMIALATAFLTLTTAHAITNLLRLNEGLVNLRDSFQGGPPAFFSSATQTYFLVRSGFYATQTLLADAVVVYRCFVVWQSIKVTLFPIILWLGLLASILGAFHALGQAAVDSDGIQIFGLSNWVNAFFAMSLTTNLISTSFLAFRIWTVNKRAVQYRVSAGTLDSVFRVVIDSGILYSATLIVTIITFVSRSNSQYIFLDLLMPVMAISFYMIIFRISRTRGGRSNSNAIESASPAHRSHQTDYQLRPVELVHISQLTKHDAVASKDGIGDKTLESERIRVGCHSRTAQWS
ncbi:hypothetical protein K435DRAFT_728208 [Dendrothele bispora CBS 962.96]|uniref:Uncharacterized protein n=1 Tax=Dendrothele bispora (strain CBS 962.96) TaxID=1314807 RepID=A0A4S8LND1_DENBC|nr:hypothetical protein K435DRAFT_728208 [Dendrothele bispora CBS 962.96]